VLEQIKGNVIEEWFLQIIKTGVVNNMQRLPQKDTTKLKKYEFGEWGGKSGR
jgi:hypothetical protein